MILDHLDNCAAYASGHRLFAKAFEFLKRPDLGSLPAGRHEVDGPTLYAVVVRERGKGQAGTRLEAHHKYIDIQFSFAADDMIGWKSAPLCSPAAGGYDEKKDIEFFADKPDAWVRVPQGHFAIYYPHDAHAPNGADGAVHKIVMKIAI